MELTINNIITVVLLWILGIFLFVITLPICSDIHDQFLSWKESRKTKTEPMHKITLPHTERNVNIMLKNVIKEERKKKKLSLSELARRSGHAVSTLHAIENGENSNPSYRTIADICAALNLSLDELERHIQESRSDNLS
jgi:DNA-binding XRE family transcriptional regulator